MPKKKHVREVLRVVNGEGSIEGRGAPSCTSKSKKKGYEKGLRKKFSVSVHWMQRTTGEGGPRHEGRKKKKENSDGTVSFHGGVFTGWGGGFLGVKENKYLSAKGALWGERQSPRQFGTVV